MDGHGRDTPFYQKLWKGKPQCNPLPQVPEHFFAGLVFLFRSMCNCVENDKIFFIAMHSKIYTYIRYRRIKGANVNQILLQ